MPSWAGQWTPPYVLIAGTAETIMDQWYPQGGRGNSKIGGRLVGRRWFARVFFVWRAHAFQTHRLPLYTLVQSPTYAQQVFHDFDFWTALSPQRGSNHNFQKSHEPLSATFPTFRALGPSFFQLPFSADFFSSGCFSLDGLPKVGSLTSTLPSVIPHETTRAASALWIRCDVYLTAFFSSW